METFDPPSKSVVESWYRCQNADRTVRTLFESILQPEVQIALTAWNHAVDDPGLLIGDLAISYHWLPITMLTVDVLYQLEHQIPKAVHGFIRLDTREFRHIETNIEIAISDPVYNQVDAGLTQRMFDHAHVVDGILVADSGGMVALKMQRGNRRDLGDVESLIRAGNVHIEPYQNYLTTDQIDLYHQIQQEIQNEVPLGD